MLNDKVKIANALIGHNEKPYVIAEAGSNFNQSFDLAIEATMDSNRQDIKSDLSIAPVFNIQLKLATADFIAFIVVSTCVFDLPTDPVRN